MAKGELASTTVPPRIRNWSTANRSTSVMPWGATRTSTSTSPGTRPKIIGRLPAEGLQAASIRYLHHHVILNYHYYLSDENLLNLSPETEALLAGYQQKSAEALILLVSYPEATATSNAFANFNRHYLEQGGKNGLVVLENNKWSGSKISGRLLLIILEADRRQLAEILLKTVDLADEERRLK